MNQEKQVFLHKEVNFVRCKTISVSNGAKFFATQFALINDCRFCMAILL